jgi:pilus assembly protein Flp/PilA
MNLMMRLFKEEEGQGMTEYALIIGFVAVALIITMVAFKDKIKAFFDGLSFVAPTT